MSPAPGDDRRDEPGRGPDEAKVKRSTIRKFREHYSGWDLTYTLDRLIEEIHQEMTERLSVSESD